MHGLFRGCASYCVRSVGHMHFAMRNSQSSSLNYGTATHPIFTALHRIASSCVVMSHVCSFSCRSHTSRSQPITLAAYQLAKAKIEFHAQAANLVSAVDVGHNAAESCGILLTRLQARASRNGCRLPPSTPPHPPTPTHKT